MCKELKVRLATTVVQWIADNDMTQAETAVFLETTQPRVSLISRMLLDSISLEALVAYVERIGYTVNIELN